MNKIIKTIYNRWKVFKKKYPGLISSLVLGINMILIAVIFEEAGARGLLFALAVLLVLVFVRVLMGWHLIMDLMRNAETIIFGRPLDKDAWKKGELKNTKVKMLWKKKKIQKKK